MVGKGCCRKLRKVVGGLIFFSLLIIHPLTSWAWEATPYRPGKPNLASKPGRAFIPSPAIIPQESSAQEEAVPPSLEVDLEPCKPLVSPSAPPFASYLVALTNAANRLRDLQGGDGGWDWEVTGAAVHSGGASEDNLYGVNGLALLDAFRATGSGGYLTDAQDAGDYLKTVAPADLYFSDMVFLYELSQVTGDLSYQAAGEAGILDVYTNWTSQAIIDDYYANRSALFGPNPAPFMAYDFAWTILAYTTYAYVNVDYSERARELLELAVPGQNPGVYKTQFQGAFLCGLGTDGGGNDYQFYWTGGQGLMLYALQKLYPRLPSTARSRCKTAIKEGLERLVMSLYTDPAQLGALTSGWYSVNGASLVREDIDWGFGYEAQAQAYALWALGYGMAPNSDYFYLAATFAVNTQITSPPAGGWVRAPNGYISWAAHPEEYTEPDAAMVRGLYMAWATKFISAEDVEPIFVGNPFGGVSYAVDFATSSTNLDAGFYVYTTGFTSAKSKQVSKGNWNQVLQAATSGGPIYWRFRKKSGGIVTPSDTYEYYLLEVPQIAPFLIQLPAGSPPPYIQPATPPPTFSWLMNGNKTFMLQFTNGLTTKSAPAQTYKNKYTLTSTLWNSIRNMEAASSPISWWIKATDRLGRVTYSETRTFSIP